MSLRSSISLVAVLSLMASAPSGVGAQSGAGRSSADRGFCLKAPPLPALGPERPWVKGEQGGAPGPMARRHGDMAMALPALPPPPPPPSPPASAVAPSSDAPITVTGARAAIRDDGRVAEGAAAPARIAPPHPPHPPRPPRPQPAPQAGLLTAGEHDDLLNPELYARYARGSDVGQAIRDLPVLDTRNVLTVEVRDDAGRPVPFATVRLTCSDGNSLAAATLADGRAVFFPGVDRLSPTVRIAANRDGQAVGRELTVQTGGAGAGGQLVTLRGDAMARSVAKLDLMLVIDTTGSMSDELRYLQTELRAVIDALVRRHPQLDVRIGFVFYRDEGDDYVTHSLPFAGRMDRTQAALDGQFASGGGDYPEAMDQALIRAIAQDWRPDAAKSLLLVADAPPHDDKVGRTWEAARVAREKRIQITPVAASGVADMAEYAMRAMAALTQSRYLFLTDDSGVGNPHAPPAIDCYLVTRLDALLRRVLDSQISGRRIEPDKDEIIRTVGEYEAGRCVLPSGFASAGGTAGRGGGPTG